MATLNKVADKKYHQEAGSFFAKLGQENIQKISAWLKKHNFYIEEKIFEDGSRKLSIGSKDSSGLFYPIIEPLTEAQTALEGQFSGEDLLEFVSSAGQKNLTGKSKKMMDRVIGVSPSAAEDIRKDEPAALVLLRLENSPFFEQDYPEFSKMLTDRNFLKYHERIKEVNADPEKVNTQILPDMERDTELLGKVRESWAKQREDILEKEKDEANIEL